MIEITNIILLEEAGQDIDNGKQYYDNQQFGIGDYFKDSIISDIESLYLYAGIHSKQLGLYRMISKRFPYAIYYKVEKNVVIVIAILDMRRDPNEVGKKLMKRK